MNFIKITVENHRIDGVTVKRGLTKFSNDLQSVLNHINWTYPITVQRDKKAIALSTYAARYSQAALGITRDN